MMYYKKEELSRALRKRKVRDKNGMKLRWETDKERLLRWMNIPPKKKLEWLRKMNETMEQTGSIKRLRLIRKKLMEQ